MKHFVIILNCMKKSKNQNRTKMMIVPGVTPVILVVAVIVMTEVTGHQGSTGILLNTSSKESKFLKCISLSTIIMLQYFTNENFMIFIVHESFMLYSTMQNFCGL